MEEKEDTLEFDENLDEEMEVKEETLEFDEDLDEEVEDIVYDDDMMEQETEGGLMEVKEENKIQEEILIQPKEEFNLNENNMTDVKIPSGITLKRVGQHPIDMAEDVGKLENTPRSE